MKRVVFCALAASLILAGGAVAHDTSPGACKVEEWRWWHTKALRVMGIEGVTTCDTGTVNLRAYDQKDGGRIFLGVGSTFIEGRIFKTTILAVEPRPSDPVVEFTVIPDE